jgi:hypothetical protein
MPWILCGPGWPPDSTGRILRLDRDDMQRRLARLQHLADAGDGAAGADAGNEDVDVAPCVSFQISSAVVLRWISGIGGFSNCCGMTALGESRS